MEKLQIKLSAITDIHNFVGLLAKYTSDFDLQSGRYTVNAKSLMGIFSLDLLKPLDFIIHSDDENIVNEVMKDIKAWLV